ncbi:MAG: hypothetical protein LBV04_07945, partial [Deferribacteraceae bacterium]|nr:hypothetical protein [Deferribacteraceae bacterium]
MAKRKQELEAVPVDKLDLFVKTHFKKILAVAGGAIIAVLAVYGIMNMMDGQKQASYEVLGQRELVGLYTTESI